MTTLAKNDIQLAQRSFPPEGTVSHRHRALRVLFICGDTRLMERCVQKLKEAQFTVDADVALTVARCSEQLLSQSYDVVVAEYASSMQGAQVLQLLRQTVQETPLVLVVPARDTRVMAEVIAHGPCDYVEREHLAQLPMVVRRALNERKLRAELEEIGKALRHSQTCHLALVNNPAYGIFRCDANGKFLDVNQTLVSMLGYTTKAELLAASQVCNNFPDLGLVRPLGGVSPETMLIQPVEVEWGRKNGTILKVKLSGGAGYENDGKFSGYQIIAADLTEQHALEERLRNQASSDPLTGLANHRRLFEVLHGEVDRAKRTGREFSVLLLDLDQLKEINDRFGHLAGDRALCRLAQVIKDCSRSVDTAARQGGDEFALVLPEADLAAAKLVGRRICDLLANFAEEPALSVSVGMASFPKNADTVAALIYAADTDLYAMKDKLPKRARSARV